VALELVLHELLLAALQEARQGDEIGVEFTERRADRAEVTLLCKPPRRVIADASALERLTGLARQMGAELRATDMAISLAIPIGRLDAGVRDPERVAPVAGPNGTADVAPVAGPPSGDGEPGHDVRRAREREHGESSRF
jgi:hypothetical protein